ncbi:MAG TPA: hypothetical protein EYP79_03775 [Campylobacterales bacterium]|nr:hypothetical protein [Campylobacterales bacterium]
MEKHKKSTNLYAQDGKLVAISLGAKLENYLYEKIKESNGEMPPLDPFIVQDIIKQISSYLEKFVIENATPVLLTSASIRRYIRKIIEPYLSNVVVLSYSEIESRTKLNILGKVEIDENK